MDMLRNFLACVPLGKKYKHRVAVMSQAASTVTPEACKLHAESVLKGCWKTWMVLLVTQKVCFSLVAKKALKLSLHVEFQDYWMSFLGELGHCSLHSLALSLQVTIGGL